VFVRFALNGNNEASNFVGHNEEKPTILIRLAAMIVYAAITVLKVFSLMKISRLIISALPRV